MTITISPNASDVITINISNSDNITLNINSIVLLNGDATYSKILPPTTSGGITTQYIGLTRQPNALESDAVWRVARVRYNATTGAEIDTTWSGTAYDQRLDQFTPQSLTLVPAGTIETVDGEYQNFTWDGAHIGTPWDAPLWFAELPTPIRKRAYQIQVKAPDIVGSDGSGSASIIIADCAAVDMFNSQNFIRVEFLKYGREGIPSSLFVQKDTASGADFAMVWATTSPAVGSVITLTLDDAGIGFAWDGGSDSIPLPAGFFTNPPNVIARSFNAVAADLVPLSVKVMEG